MIVAADIYYFDTNKAKAAAVTFDHWTDAEVQEIFTCYLDNVQEYIPGEFYKRELPCILEVLKQVDLKQVEAIVIDGYVVLDNKGKLGLGGYLYQALDGLIAIIGVAKTSFANNTQQVIEVVRGDSKRPLFVTAIGIDNALAADYVRSMAGEFRFPTLLKEVDKISKNIL